MLLKGLRYKFITFLIRRIFKIPEGSVIPKYLTFIKFCFFPLKYLIYKVNNNIYDFCTDTYTINGLKFSSNFFNISIIGKRFEIIQLDNGVVTIKNL